MGNTEDECEERKDKKKIRIVFECDPIELFDAMNAMNGDPAPIGARIVGAMMTGKIPFSDEIAMAVYGIKVSEIGYCK